MNNVDEDLLYFLWSSSLNLHIQPIKCTLYQIKRSVIVLKHFMENNIHLKKYFTIGSTIVL